MFLGLPTLSSTAQLPRATQDTPRLPGRWYDGGATSGFPSTWPAQADRAPLDTKSPNEGQEGEPRTWGAPTRRSLGPRRTWGPQCLSAKQGPHLPQCNQVLHLPLTADPRTVIGRPRVTPSQRAPRELDLGQVPLVLLTQRGELGGCLRPSPPLVSRQQPLQQRTPLRRTVTERGPRKQSVSTAAGLLNCFSKSSPGLEKAKLKTRIRAPGQLVNSSASHSG